MNQIFGWNVWPCVCCVASGCVFECVFPSVCRGTPVDSIMVLMEASVFMEMSFCSKTLHVWVATINVERCNPSIIGTKRRLDASVMSRHQSYPNSPGGRDKSHAEVHWPITALFSLALQARLHVIDSALQHYLNQI